MLTQLNSMTVNKDSLTVSLPYIGKEGSSGNTGGNPLQFTTTDFTYKVEVTKKKDKIITMEVKSPGSDRFTFMLTISKGIIAFSDEFFGIHSRAGNHGRGIARRFRIHTTTGAFGKCPRFLLTATDLSTLFS